MSRAEWFAIARDAVLLVVWVLVFYWGQDRKKTQTAIDEKIAELRMEMDKSFAHMIERFEHANNEGSKLSGMVQGLIGRVDRMPDDLRSKFLPLDRALDAMEESKRDRAAIWTILREREVDRRKP